MTYPTNRLLAVVDAPDVADRVANDIARELGLDAEVLRGPDGEKLFRGAGPARRRWTSLVRIFQFMSMDQGPDFHIYEAALREGRSVVAVRVSGRARIDAAAAALRAAGAHFLNYFGRFQTEEIAPWRGPEPAVPDYLKR